MGCNWTLSDPSHEVEDASRSVAPTARKTARDGLCVRRLSAVRWLSLSIHVQRRSAMTITIGYLRKLLVVTLRAQHLRR
jgi:hypothetical protein